MTITVTGPICGDATGDGRITASDALRVLQAAVGIGTCSEHVCDFNGSGAVTASDALGGAANGRGSALRLPVPVRRAVGKTRQRRYQFSSLNLWIHCRPEVSVHGSDNPHDPTGAKGAACDAAQTRAPGNPDGFW
ncbi:MAG: hypothetical protein HY899_19620 [Deltaproteobacteria bacterium]|nr:hypothetical protein [Deltaproteobacteria bacterium]